FDPNPAVPLAVFPKDFALLTERSPWQGQGPIDGAMFLHRDIQLAYTLDHDPQVQARGAPWGLDLRCVNQFSAQRGRRKRFAGFASGLKTTAKVCERTAGCSSSKLARALTRGDTG